MYYVVAEERSSTRYVEVVGPFMAKEDAAKAMPRVQELFHDAGSQVERMDVRLMASTAADRLSSEGITSPEELWRWGL
jgi:hypothetical protein